MAARTKLFYVGIRETMDMSSNFGDRETQWTILARKTHPFSNFRSPNSHNASDTLLFLTHPAHTAAHDVLAVHALIPRSGGVS